MPFWWHSFEWARGEERSWVDDAVEAVIGVEKAKAVRGRCLALLEAEEDDPDNLVMPCRDVGLDDDWDVRTWWFRTAVMHLVPDVKDLVGNYVLLRFDEASAGSIEAVVHVVDRIFDLCWENGPPDIEVRVQRAPTIEVQILPWSLTELAATKMGNEFDRKRDLKKLWDGMTVERRKELKTETRHWTARRLRMTPDQRLVDDRESFVSYDLLMDLVANASGCNALS
jgi:hypothetical protein